MDASDASATAPSHFIATYPTESLDSEFMQKYPPDRFGEEMADDARVWRVYRDEATASDKSMLDGWNKTLDVLLIFAGLFSAVATAFVVESYKLLQPDYEAYVANALFAQLSIRDGSGKRDRPPDPSQFTPSPSSLWLNGLWFTSLVLSLAVAFLCILSKQWLEEYNSRISMPSESPHQWARRRTFFFDGLNSWHVPVLIAGLPTLLHLALFLFLAGLVVLLSTLDRSSTVWIFAITGFLFFFYVASTVLPILRHDCPSSTPLIPQLRITWVKVRRLICRAILVLFPIYDARVPSESWPQFLARQRLFQVCTRCARSVTALWTSAPYETAYYTISYRMRRWQELKWGLWGHAVRVLHHSVKAKLARLAIEPKLDPVLSPCRQDEVDAYALRWLISACPLPKVASVGIQAIGALEPWSPVAATLRTDSIRSAIERCLKPIYQARMPPGNADMYGCSLPDMARDLRSLICLYGSRAVNVMDNCAPALLETASSRGSFQYDLGVMVGVLFHTSYLKSGRRGRTRRRSALTLIKQCTLAPHDAHFRAHFLLSTALQLLDISALPWQFRLHMIYVLPMQDVTVEAFVRITAAFRLKLDHATCPIAFLHRGRACRVQCSIELLSELISRRDSLALGADEVEFLFQIVVRVMKDRRKLAQAGENFDLMPIHGSHFIALIGSPFFAERWQELSINDLNGIATQLGEMIQSFSHLRSAWTGDVEQAIVSVLKAAMGALARADRDTLIVSNCMIIAITGMFGMTPGRSHVLIAEATDISTLPIDLLQGGTDSAWFMLQPLENAQRVPQDAHESLMSRVSDLLAAVLCYASRRGHDVADKVDTFFAAGSHGAERFISLQTIPHAWRWRSNAHTNFVVFVRHCNELRPGWSRTVLERAIEIKGPEYESSLRSFMAEIEEAAAEHGPCTECPGGVRDAVPSRWMWRIGRPRLTV